MPGPALGTEDPEVDLPQLLSPRVPTLVGEADPRPPEPWNCSQMDVGHGGGGLAVLTEATWKEKATNHTNTISPFPSSCLIAVSGWRRSSVVNALLRGLTGSL